ncbi:MAG: adenylate kinase [Blautia sp.]|nr:adenylate kinase [Eubacteriales bacterium]MED9966338.1 adenylate kinase [Blautia sp.]
MEKAIIIGCPGAGKSTFARKLKEKTGLPLFYLDMIWHKADGTNISRDEFDGKIKEIMKKEQWILDGNYIRTLEMRLKECDTVFLLDYPLELCLEGASSRIGKERPDMPWVESEFDLEFRQFIVDFPKDSLPKIYELLKKYEKEKELHIFRKREDAEEYLRTEERNGKV